MKRLVGKVTEEEKIEIQSIFERKNGLNELIQVLKPNNDMYEKLVTDMGKTSTRFQNWWDSTARKYNWESDPRGNWEINFETNEIFLNIPD